MPNRCSWLGHNRSGRYPNRCRFVSLWRVVLAVSASAFSPASLNSSRCRTAVSLYSRISYHNSVRRFTACENMGLFLSSRASPESSSTTSLRRSTRIRNETSGVSLFHARSDDESNIENDNRLVSPEDCDEKPVPVTPSRKRATRSRAARLEAKAPSKRARTESAAAATTPKRRRVSTKAIPVTPESADAAKPSPKKTKAKPSPKKTKAKPAKKTPARLSSWDAPDGWKETYELVQELRRDKTAPCDKAGAEALVLPPPKDAVDLEEYEKTARFQTLIALMLSSQTKDAMVGQAMENLRDTDGGLTVTSMLEIDPKLLNEKIYSVGFRNNKTKYIKEAAQVLHEKYDDDIPATAAEMIRDLPGVGPKMAFIVENICWNRQTGIGVDTHMHRLFPQLGWVSPDTKNPEQTRRQLESWLPQQYWAEVNLLWVGFGQEVQQERQKALRKALNSSRPMDALELLKSIDFDIVGEWDKMVSLASSLVDDPKIDEASMLMAWKDDDEREKMSKMIEELRVAGRGK